MPDKKCKILQSLTGDFYAVTKIFKDGSTNDKHKYLIENWPDVQSKVLEDILKPMDVSPALWSKFIHGKAKIVECKEE